MNKYDIGIDIGTASIGWAVVDQEKKKVIRKFNKKLWGVLLFDEGTTAEARRIKRGTRKRYDRRRKRIKLLQKEFQEEMNKVDKAFYKKMKETFLWQEDRNIMKTSDEEIWKKYQKKYPTIFHLRKELLETKEKMDIRLVYLAMHHIIKYRGNFLHENNNFKIESLNIEEKIEEVINIVQKKDLDQQIDLPTESLENILNKTEEKETYLKKYFKSLFHTNEREWTNMVLGKSFNVQKLFQIEIEDKELTKLSFKEDNYEAKKVKLEKELKENIMILDYMQEIYNIDYLKKLLSTEKYISLAMVNNYNKHKEDLKILKTALKKLEKKQYKSFLQKDDSIYRKYVRNKITYEEFIKELEKVIEKIEDKNQKEVELLKETMRQKDFLPRITSKDNGTIPYQVHKMELEKIIENQGKYYPFLLNKTKNNNYRITEILKFRIPYYVGPLNNTTKEKTKTNPNAWACMKKNAFITPFNFEEIIDIDESATKFIERMISHCTYLTEEKVLPTNSILYSKFKVWNELKQLKINERKIPHKLQKKIMEELFERKRNITEKDLKNFLHQTGEYNMYDDLEITGFSAEKKFANNRNSFIDFFGKDGIFEGTNYNEQDAEQIITWITIFEDKNILERKILKEYPDLKNKLPEIKSKKYNGWGNLSKRLLTQIYYKNDLQEDKSILDLMQETPDNFMQIITSKKYCFEEQINNINKEKKTKKLNYQLVEDLMTSPANKKGIYEALKIIDEIIKFMGYKPESISIEMARKEGKKERIPDKKRQLEKIYLECQKEISNYCEYKKIKKDLQSIDKIDAEKLYLYFIQEGKSLYSKTPLNILELENYEVDLILPRTLVKDNSWDNKALVLQKENQDKRDSLVLPESYRNENKNWWKHLLKVGLISQKKYNNLCRETFSEEIIEGFIARQLVETRQICKHVANIVENMYEGVNVISLHADLSHNYREKFELFKFREINDYHHAHDAYLAAVIGNYQKKYLKKITSTKQLQNMKQYILDEEERKRKLKYGYVINSLDPIFKLYNKETKEVLFDIEEFNKTIENTLYQNDIIINRKTELKTTGEFYNESKNKKDAKLKKPIPLKKGLSPEKYGSYSGIKCAYMVLVKYKKKNKEEQELVGMPIMYAESYQKDKSIVLPYFKKLLKLKEEDKLEIIDHKIPFNTLIHLNENNYYITGAGIELQNATELKIPKEKMIKWKFSLNILLNKKKKELTEKYEEHLKEIFQFIIVEMEKNYKMFEKERKEISEKIIFSNLSIEEKEDVIKQLFKMLRCDGVNANLKKYNLNERCGRLKGKKIEHGVIISKSVTGIKEKKYEF